MTVTRFAVTLLATMILVGCASVSRQPDQTSDRPTRTPAETTQQALPETMAYLFPPVPFYPAASRHEVLADQRAIINVSADGASKVVAWFHANMQSSGWKEEDTSLPSDTVLLFSRDGRYVSISGHDTPGGSVIWFHIRSAREVTAQEALTIARNTHRIQAEWSATLIREFETEQDGIHYKHPVWLVEATPGNDAVWVDAITAEPFRIRQ